MKRNLELIRAVLPLVSFAVIMYTHHHSKEYS
jgi:hypothetical protein